MRTDLYTKAILTVIAICLTVNLLKEFEVIPTAQAAAPSPMPTATTQSNVVDVRIVETKEPVPIDIKKINGETLFTYKANNYPEYQLPVRIMNK